MLVSKYNRDSPILKMPMATDAEAWEIIHGILSTPYSPYYDIPTSTHAKMNSQLAIGLSAGLDPLLKIGGGFNLVHIYELDHRLAVIINFFSVFRNIYKDQWLNSEYNPFAHSYYIASSLSVLNHAVMPRCYKRRDFSQQSMAKILGITHKITDEIGYSTIALSSHDFISILERNIPKKLKTRESGFKF